MSKYTIFNRLYHTFILYNCYTVLHSRVASSSSVPRRVFIELDYVIYDRIRNRALNNHAGVQARAEGGTTGDNAPGPTFEGGPEGAPLAPKIYKIENYCPLYGAESYKRALFLPKGPFAASGNPCC